jgi:predicted CoA-binding protein
MDPITRLLAEPDPTIAVVGATDRLDAYGARIYRDLKAKGYRVMAVNPTRDTVDGDPAYRSLSDLPESPTIVNYVIPPPRTRRVLEEALRLGYTTAWVQPGAEDDEVVRFLDEHGFESLVGACIMVESRAIA